MKPCSTISTNRVQLLCITLDPLGGLGGGGLATWTLRNLSLRSHNDFILYFFLITISYVCSEVRTVQQANVTHFTQSSCFRWIWYSRIRCCDRNVYKISTFCLQRSNKKTAEHCSWMISSPVDWIYQIPALFVLVTNVLFLLRIMWVSYTHKMCRFNGFYVYFT